ncbi:unnamed protein product, partial [Pylaiella littoralis]
MRGVFAVCPCGPRCTWRRFRVSDGGQGSKRRRRCSQRNGHAYGLESRCLKVGPYSICIRAAFGVRTLRFRDEKRVKSTRKEVARVAARKGDTRRTMPTGTE